MPTTKLIPAPPPPYLENSTKIINFFIETFPKNGLVRTKLCIPIKCFTAGNREREREREERDIERERVERGR